MYIQRKKDSCVCRYRKRKREIERSEMTQMRKKAGSMKTDLGVFPEWVIGFGWKCGIRRTSVKGSI